MSPDKYYSSINIAQKGRFVNHLDFAIVSNDINQGYESFIKTSIIKNEKEQTRVPIGKSLKDKDKYYKYGHFGNYLIQIKDILVVYKNQKKCYNNRI